MIVHEMGNVIRCNTTYFGVSCKQDITFNL